MIVHLIYNYGKKNNHYLLINVAITFYFAASKLLANCRKELKEENSDV